jgi:hypothetical protein
VQALVGGGGDRRDHFVAEVDEFGAKTADAVDEQLNAARAANRRNRAQVVEPTRGRLVMHDGQMRESSGARCIEFGGNCLHIRRTHPGSDEALVIDMIAGADLRDTLSIHAIFHDQKSAFLRHQRGDHALHGSSARSGQKDGRPNFGIEIMGLQQVRSGVVLEVVEFALPMVQVRLQEAATHAFGQGDGTRIEQ